MIDIKKDDYILGLWYAERIGLGKVYIWAIKGKEDNEWIGHIRYRYNNLNLSLAVDDSNPQNKFICLNISENDMQKKCLDRIGELSILFCHEREHVIVKGDISKLEKMAVRRTWIPRVRFGSLHKKKKG